MPLNLARDDQLAACLTRIDDAAAAARARYMTTMRAQQAEYDAKLTEANGLLSALPGTTPIIDAEANARGISRSAMAKLVKDRRKKCEEIVAAIAKIRSPAKARAKADPSKAPAIAAQAVRDLAAV